MTKHTILRQSDCFSDFECPSCGIPLEWDEDKLYPFTVEAVECSICECKFYAKMKIVKTFEIMRK